MNRNNQKKGQKTIKIGDKEYIMKGCGIYENVVGEEKKKADEMSIRTLLQPQLPPPKPERDPLLFPNVASAKVNPTLSHIRLPMEKKGLDKDVLDELEKISLRLLNKKK